MSDKYAYVWGIASRFGPQAIYLLTTMMLARYVTPNDFGMIGVLAIIFTVANILIDSGLGGSLIKENQISKVDCSTITIFNIVIGFFIYILLYLLSGYIERYFAIEDLSTVVKLISIIFPITALGVVPVSLLKRNLKFKEICISSLLGVSFASIISIILAIKGAGVYSLVIYQIVVNTIMVLCNYIFSRYKFIFYFSLSSLKRLLPFGFYTSIVTIIDTIYENLITLLTGKFLNVQSAGYLYQAKRLEETMSTSFAVSVGIVAFPVLTKLKEDKSLFVFECIRTFNTITFLSFPILIIVAIFSEEIMLVLFGKQWLVSSEYLRILTFAGVFIIMEQMILSFIKALGRVRNLMYITIFKRIIGIIVLLSCLVINPQYLVYAYLITTIIGFIINVLLFNSLANISTMELALIAGYNTYPLVCIFIICMIMKSYNVCGVLTGLSAICFLLYYYLEYSKRRNVDIIGFIRKIRK